MKRILLIIMAFLPLYLFAQESTSFVKEGKIWRCGAMPTGGNPTEDYPGWNPNPQPSSTYIMSGDSIINCMTYKKVVLYSYNIFHDENPHSICCVREQGSKVYMVRDGCSAEEVLYDFGMTVGESLEWHDCTLYEWWNQDDINYKSVPLMQLTCTEVTTTYTNMIARRMTKNTWTTGESPTSSRVCVEGIGYDDNPFLCCYQEPTVSVEEDGKVVFTEDDFRHPTSVLSMKSGWKWIGTEKNINNVVYDHSFYLDGDTIISGRNGVRVFRKWERDGDQDFRYAGALFEEGDQVFFCEAGTTDWQLLYDFGLQVGDKRVVKWSRSGHYMLLGDEGEEAEALDEFFLTAFKVDYVKVGDALARRIFFEITYKELEEYVTQGYAYWVEGIGSYNGLLNISSIPWPNSYGNWVLEVLDANGNVVFTKEDFWSDGASIRDVSPINAKGNNGLHPKFGKGTWYSLDGRQQSARVRGLNIVRESDGSVRKVIVR